MTPETLTLLAAGFFALLAAWSFGGEIRSRVLRRRRLVALRAARRWPRGWKSTT